MRKAVDKLCMELQSERSIYGRLLKMIGLMEKGTTLAEMGRKLRCSHRTAFGHLNHLEDAGISFTLDGSKCSVNRSMPKML